MGMTRQDLKQVEAIVLDPEPDERGNVFVIVRLEDERSTALAFNAN
ncbi:hypothetical protein C8N24_5698 [Solirubrobacter pauli]|uniref:Uncharacterized protein n=1 Tax=Solirubrobacter pauli TaxID=166793 RepID=A0A660L6V3_9ACTN|nr:hypothetical protein [Solirubrobacter pauli]RKQ87673.1 hypothetical protein C8N24_5698 [Solirubrobacter pauli]